MRPTRGPHHKWRGGTVCLNRRLNTRDRTNGIVEELSASSVFPAITITGTSGWSTLVSTDDTMSPCNFLSQWTENIWMFLHIPLQLPDFKEQHTGKQEIMFRHHPTRRTRTRAMFTAFSSSIITIVGHQVSEETSDKTDMVTTHTHPASRLH